MPTVRAGCTVLGGRIVEMTELVSQTGAAASPEVVRKRAADIDEDGVTLAVAAIRRLFVNTGATPGDIGRLMVVGLDDEDAHAVVLGAIGRDDLHVAAFAPSPEAAMEALFVAADSEAAQPSLLVATSDGRGNGIHSGAGAAALLVGHGDGARLLDGAQRRFGASDSTDARDVITALGADAHQVAFAEQVIGEARELAAALGRRSVVRPPIRETGALGAVAPYAALLSVLRRGTAGERFDLIVPGSHAVLGARFESGSGVYEGVEDALEATAVPTDAATALRVTDAWRLAAHRVSQGAFVSLQQYRAEAAARYRMAGQRCSACSRVLFPPRRTCPDDPQAALKVQPLSGRGVVHARTLIAQGAAPSEFAPQQDAVGTYAVAIVTLEEGPMVAAQLCGPSALDLKIGDPVVAELRLLYVQENVPRYGFKFRSAADAMD